MDYSQLDNTIPIIDVDFSKTPEELAIELINKDNGTNLKAEEFFFGIPVPNDGLVNTSITITANEEISKYRGNVTVAYNRMDFDVVRQGNDDPIEIGLTETTIGDIIPIIDDTYGLNLEARDYVDGPLPSFTTGVGEVLPLVVEAGEESLIFIKELNIGIRKPFLGEFNTLFADGLLDGLHYTKPIDVCQYMEVIVQ